MKKTLKLICNCIIVVSLGLLIAPATMAGLIIAVVLSIIAAVLFLILAEHIEDRLYLHIEYMLYEVTLSFMLARDFVSRWERSSKMEALSSLLHVSHVYLLAGIAVLLGLLSVLAVDRFLVVLKTSLQKLPNRWIWVKKTLLLALLFCTQYLMIELSALGRLNVILQKKPGVFITNILMIGIANLCLAIVLQSWKTTITVSSIIFAAWSIANYYTIRFHGSPLFLSEFANALTAAAVAGNYRFKISGEIICIVLLLLSGLQLGRQTLALLDTERSFRRRLFIRLAFLLCLSLVFFPLYRRSVLVDRPWMPWDVSIENGGFLLCTAEDVEKRADPVLEPDGYDISKLPAVDIPYAAADDVLPDIILILNETFCDLDLYLDLTVDHDPLSDYSAIQNAVYGNAVVPSVGGGTNNTEFEFLTSKSMYLLKSMAPFTYLDLELLERSTVNYLKSYGYTTAGLHCEQGRNYSRDTAYPAIGFDQVLLGHEQFAYYGTNGRRAWLDSDNYRDLIDVYDRMDDSPRFLYLLTFQNHGGYEQNEPSFDTVHVQNDFGGLTDDLDEFLSSLELSAEAFKKLSEHYAGVNRRVIICMVGDHAPSFNSELTPNRELSYEESEIFKRVVPFVIWNNYGAQLSAYSEYASMVDLLPMIMQMAEIPRTTFYQTILDIHEKVPVRTSNGIYMDREGDYGIIMETDMYYNLLKPYYYLEYNSLLQDDYEDELFE